MNFNKESCLKLLKTRKRVQKQGKSLIEYNKTQAKELDSYLGMIEDQVFWESRTEYIQILESFLSEEIIFTDFFLEFCGLRASNMDSYQMWENSLEEEACGILTQLNKKDSQLNLESTRFSEKISTIHSLIDLWDPDITLEMNFNDLDSIGYGISEELFRILMEDYCLPELKAYCNNS